MEFPKLIEQNIKYNINYNLKTIRNFKDKYITIFVNIFLFLILVISLGSFLYFKYKGKLTPEELHQKEQEKFLM